VLGGVQLVQQIAGKRNGPRHSSKNVNNNNNGKGKELRKNVNKSKLEKQEG